MKLRPGEGEGFGIRAIMDLKTMNMMKGVKSTKQYKKIIKL